MMSEAEKVILPDQKVHRQDIQNHEVQEEVQNLITQLLEVPVGKAILNRNLLGRNIVIHQDQILPENRIETTPEVQAEVKAIQDQDLLLHGRDRPGQDLLQEAAAEVHPKVVKVNADNLLWRTQ